MERTSKSQKNSKVSVLTGIEYKMGYCLNANRIRQIYLTIKYPSFLYCSAVWGEAYKTYIDSHFITRKTLLRIMSFKKKL